MNDAFFEAFNADLQNKAVWHEFHTSHRKGQGKLKDAAMQNPSLLGDPVSLKAEKADSQPTDQDKGAGTDVGAHPKPDIKEKGAKKPQGKSKLKDAAMKNPSLLGDPVSMKAEKSNSEPTDQDRGAQSSSSTLTSATSSTEHNASSTPSNPSSTPSLPSLPTIDGKALFWAMMDHARTPDPYVFPALLRLNSAPSSHRPILGALSNTVIFPPNHPYNRLPSIPASSQVTVASDSDPRTHFDVFVASAEVGMRKPDARIYELAVKKLDEFDRQKGGEGVKAEEVLFLDDIGENLKTAREMGMRTMKVVLGKTHRAVKELERAVGMELMDEKTRRTKL